MIQQSNLPGNLKGLTDEEVIASRRQHGTNVQYQRVKHTWWKLILDILKDPMLIILLLIAILYFIVGQNGEGFFMIGAIAIVAGISFYQENRSRIALEALQSLNTPLSRVIRNGATSPIITSELVPGDLVIAEEGGLINADGLIVYSHDFSVDESSLTGESVPVYKSESINDQQVFSGTMVSSGMAVYEVNQTGSKTRLGQLGKSLSIVTQETSPLQLQIESFVRKMLVVGILVFIIVCVVRFLKTNEILDSLLVGLTMAMSILPEEIPVAFTVFMALGSRRLINDGILVRKIKVVETLGSATVICSDKTGTITENSMKLTCIYAYDQHQIFEDLNVLNPDAIPVLEAAMWASEPHPFDPMEKALHDAYAQVAQDDARQEYAMIHEYPLGGIPAMMTHVFENERKSQIIATKGAPEAILDVSHLSQPEIEKVNQVIQRLASQGLRVLGVAIAPDKLEIFPVRQQDISFRFLGLVAFQDPPKENIRDVFTKFYDAGLEVKIITGDNATTTMAIARQAGLKDLSTFIDGKELVQMTIPELDETMKRTHVFTRMFPDAKLAAINSLKRSHHIVAMVGDGVNDGPALKAADIGIAMGKKGTEIAKSAADLILVDDDLGKLVVGIESGRRIYTNLKKAIQYIISIHIPIIATVTLPVLLGWIYPEIFTAVHVIFLELIMGPTCSIVYENEPAERNAMLQPPRPAQYSFLNWRELSLSFLQGIMISLGIFFIYHYSVKSGYDESLTRSMVFITLITANIFLTLVNRSFYYSVWETLKQKNKLVWLIITMTFTMMIAILVIPFIRSFFGMVIPHPQSLLICLITAFVSVFWFEVWKWRIRQQSRTAVQYAKSDG